MTDTLEQIAATLPNGFHDTFVSTCSLDFVNRTASFELEIWTGDLSSRDPAIRERRLAATLTIHGLLFCQIDPPDPNYDYAEADPLMIDLCPPRSHILSPHPPDGSFVSCFFVMQWNAFIYVGGRSASLSPHDSNDLSE